MSPKRLLVTGSEGLLGKALASRLRAEGYAITGLDLDGAGDEQGDVRDAARVRAALGGCSGVVHLAAISRVLWGERSPSLCWETNVTALDGLLSLAEESPLAPWIVFASSREVYGQPASLPATEDTPLSPINTYARSKVRGEELVIARGREGMAVACVRLSNVFGSPADHSDRVVPAFARAAIAGTPLRVDGAESTFDFTYLDDAIDGLAAIVARMVAERRSLPAIHLVSGVPTSLGDLAARVVAIAGTNASITHAPARSFDVARFYGDPARASALLGWSARTPLAEGLARLIAALRKAGL